jgi:hypothetical protein
VLGDQRADSRQLMSGEPCGPHQLEWLEPEFRQVPAILNVDVRRLVAFVAEEEEPLPDNPQNGWRHQTENSSSSDRG